MSGVVNLNGQAGHPVAKSHGINLRYYASLLEAIACAVDAITIGSENIRRDKTLTAVRRLSQWFKLAWQKRSHRGFFLRAEESCEIGHLEAKMAVQAAAGLYLFYRQPFHVRQDRRNPIQALVGKHLLQSHFVKKIAGDFQNFLGCAAVQP